MPNWLDPDVTDGEDLNALWRGEVSSPRTKPLYWEWLFNVQGAQDGYLPPRLAIREGGWKLFVNHGGGGAQLYDIAMDPDEFDDLAAAQPGQVKSLTDKVMTWVKTLPPSAARDTVAAAGQPAEPRPKKATKPASSKPAPTKTPVNRSTS